MAGKTLCVHYGMHTQSMGGISECMKMQPSLTIQFFQALNGPRECYMAEKSSRNKRSQTAGQQSLDF